MLRTIRGEHEIVAVIEEWREYSKLLNTYLGPLPTLIGEDGRLHTTFNQTVAATGRLSTTSPNLQAIPIRTELGREIRSAFIAEAGHKLLSADYSQVELRILAHVSGEPKLREAFEAGEDIHAATAAEVLGKERATLTKDERNVAKMVNFGIIYGISSFGLSENLEIPRDEAQALHRRVPGALPARPGLHPAHDRAVCPRRLRDDAARPAPAGARDPRLQPPDALARRTARGQLGHAGHRRRRDQGGDGAIHGRLREEGRRPATRASGARRAAARGTRARGECDQGARARGDVPRLPARPAARGGRRRGGGLERGEVLNAAAGRAKSRSCGGFCS